jgi:NAD(P)-dependent dehydrogenase (short-subunit alcohol dehydrogenase family)
VSAVFREDLLTGSRVVAAGGAPAELGRHGAEVLELPRGLDETAAEAWAAEQSPVNVLVCDARSVFAPEGLQPALQFTWSAVRAVAVGALIPAESGKVILVAPALGAPRAEALRAGLENLARTLSVEWARYGITVSALAPGAGTSEEELGQLVCFVASRAGDYFSGCRFDLGKV